MDETRDTDRRLPFVLGSRVFLETHEHDLDDIDPDVLDEIAERMWADMNRLGDGTGN